MVMKRFFAMMFMQVGWPQGAPPPRQEEGVTPPSAPNAKSTR